ncbi:MAG: LCP family protein [Candidatus Margulisiibacteriota bacterium]
MKKTKPDIYRILAICTILLGILYFYLTVFAPKFIPSFFRVATIRRPITLLLLGTDVSFDPVTKEPVFNVKGRTDSLLLIRMDPIRGKVTILSIPRDSFVPVPGGYGQQKINAVNVIGGIDLLKQTLKDLTGKEIDHYLLIDPAATIKLVDLLGGIKINVEKDMYYNDNAQDLHINLKQGEQKLSGKQAHDYIRFRHDAMGDIGRVERQQKFMESLFYTLARPSNIIKAPIALKVIFSFISTDLPLSNIVRIANFFRSISYKDVTTFVASGTPQNTSYAGSIWLLNKQELTDTINKYF